MNVFRDDVLRESTSRRIKERDMSACLTSPGSRAPRGAGGGAWRACHADVIEAWVGGGAEGLEIIQIDKQMASNKHDAAAVLHAPWFLARDSSTARARRQHEAYQRIINKESIEGISSILLH